MAQPFVIKNFTAPTGVWTPITVPIDCSKIVIENGSSANACVVRTDPNDSDTAKTLPASLELTIESNSPIAPFLANTTICWANPASGSGPLVVSYTR